MLLGDLGVYLIGGLLGVVATLLLLLMIARTSPNDAEAFGIFGFIGGGAGGLLGVAVIGPTAQLTWRVISDVIWTDPERFGNYLWPYPVSLWYSALFIGAIIGGLYVGLLAMLIAKRWVDRART